MLDVGRLALYPVYTADNIGFRCVEPYSPPVTAADGRTAKRQDWTAERQPTRHRLSETWGYKVKKVFTAIISGNSRGMRKEEL